MSVAAGAISVYEDELARVTIVNLRLDPEDLIDTEAAITLEVLVSVESGIRLVPQISSLIESDEYPSLSDDGSHLVYRLAPDLVSLDFYVSNVSSYSRQSEVVLCATSHAFNSSNSTTQQVVLNFREIALVPIIQLLPNVSTHIEDSSFELSLLMAGTKPGLMNVIAVTYQRLMIQQLVPTADRLGLHVGGQVDDETALVLMAIGADSEPTDMNFTVQFLSKMAGVTSLNVSVFALTSEVSVDEFVESPCFNETSDVESTDRGSCLSALYGKSIMMESAFTLITINPRAEPPAFELSWSSLDTIENSPVEVLVAGLSLLDRDGSESAMVELICRDARTSIDLIAILISGTIVAESSPVESALQWTTFNSTMAPTNDTQPAVSRFLIAELTSNSPTQNETTIVIQPKAFFSGAIMCRVVTVAVDEVDGLPADTAEMEMAITISVMAESSGTLLHVASEELVGIEDESFIVNGVSASLVDQDGSEDLWLILDFGNYSDGVNTVSWSRMDLSANASSDWQRLNRFGSQWVLRAGSDHVDLVGSLDILPVIGLSGVVEWTLTALSIEREFLPNNSITREPGDEEFELEWLRENWLLANVTSLAMEVTINPICHLPSGRISPTSIVTKPLRPVPIDIVVWTPDVDGSEVLSLVIVVNSSAVLSVETTGEDEYRITEWTDGAPSHDGDSRYQLVGGPSLSRIATRVYIGTSAEFVGLATVQIVVNNTEFETGETKSLVLLSSILVVPADPIVQPTRLVVSHGDQFVQLPFTRVDVEQEVMTRDHLLLFVEGDSTTVSDVYAGVSRVEPLDFLNLGPVNVYPIPYSNRHALSLRMREDFTGFLRVYFVVSTVQLVVSQSQQSAFSAERDGISASAASLLVLPRVMAAAVNARWDSEVALGSVEPSLTVRSDDAQVDTTIVTRMLIPKRSRLAAVRSTNELVFYPTERFEDREFTLLESRGLPLSILFSKELGDAAPLAVQLKIATFDVAEQQNYTDTVELRRESVNEARPAVGMMVNERLSRPLIVADDGVIELRLVPEIIAWSALADISAVRLSFLADAEIDSLSIGDVSIPIDGVGGDDSTATVFDWHAADRQMLMTEHVLVFPRRFLAQQFSMRLEAISSVDGSEDVFTSTSTSVDAVIFDVVVEPAPNDAVLKLNTTQIVGVEELHFALSIVEAWTPDQDGSEVVEISVIVDKTLLELTSVQAAWSVLLVEPLLLDASRVEYLVVSARDNVSRVDALELEFMPLPDKYGLFTIEVAVKSIELSSGETSQITKSIPVNILAMPVTIAPIINVSPFLLTGSEDDVLDASVAVTVSSHDLQYHFMVVYPSKFVDHVNIDGEMPPCRQSASASGQVVCHFSMDSALNYSINTPDVDFTIPLRLVPVAGMSGEYTVELSVLSYTEDMQDEFFDPERNECFRVAESMTDVLQCRSFRERKSLVGTATVLSAIVDPRAAAPTPVVIPMEVTASEGEPIEVAMSEFELNDLDGSEELFVTLECDTIGIDVVSLAGGLVLQPLLATDSFSRQVFRYDVATVTAATAASDLELMLTIQPVAHYSGLVSCRVITRAIDRTAHMEVEDETTVALSATIMPVATVPELVTTSNAFSIQEDDELVTDTLVAILVDRDNSEAAFLVIQFDNFEYFNNRSALAAVEWIPSSPESSNTLQWFKADGIAIISAGASGQDLAGALKLQPSVGFSGSLSWRVRALSVEREAAEVWASDIEAASAVASLVLSEDRGSDATILTQSNRLVASSMISTMVLKVEPIAHQAQIVTTPESLVTSPLLGALLRIEASSVDDDGSEQIEIALRVNASAVRELRSTSDPSDILIPTENVEGELLYIFAPIDGVDVAFQLSRSVLIVPREDFLGIFTIYVAVTTTEVVAMEQQVTEATVSTLVVPLNPSVGPAALLHAEVGGVIRVPFDRLDEAREIASRDAIVFHFERGSQWISNVFAGVQRVDAIGADSMANTSATVGAALSYVIPYARRRSIVVHLRADAPAGFVTLHLILSTVRLDSGLMSQLQQLQFNSEGMTVETMSLVIHPARPLEIMGKAIVNMVTDVTALTGNYGMALVHVDTSHAFNTNGGPPAGAMTTELVWQARSPIQMAGSNAVNQLREQNCPGSSGSCVVVGASEESMMGSSVWFQLAIRRTVSRRFAVRLSLSFWDVALQHVLDRHSDYALDIVAHPTQPELLGPMQRRTSSFELLDDADLTLSLEQLGLASNLADLILVELLVPTGSVDRITDWDRVAIPSTVLIEETGSFTSYKWYAPSSTVDIRTHKLVISPRRFLAQEIPLRVRTIAKLQATTEAAASTSVASVTQDFALVVMPCANAPVVAVSTQLVQGVEERDVSFGIDRIYTPDMDGSESVEVAVRVPITAARRLALDGVVLWTVGSTPGNATAALDEPSSSVMIVIQPRSLSKNELVNQTVMLTLQDDFFGQFAVQVIATSVEKTPTSIPTATTTQDVTFEIEPMPRALIPAVTIRAINQTVMEDDAMILQAVTTPTAISSPQFYKAMVVFPSKMVSSLGATGSSNDSWSCRTATATVVCTSSITLTSETSAVMFAASLIPTEHMSGQFDTTVAVFAFTTDLSSRYFESDCVLSSISMSDVLRCRSYRERKSLVGVEETVTLMVRPRAEPPRITLSTDGQAPLTMEENGAVTFTVSNMTLIDTDGSERVVVRLACAREDSSALLERIEVVGSGKTFTTTQGALIDFALTELDAFAPEMSDITVILRSRAYASGIASCEVIAEAVDVNPSAQNDIARERFVAALSVAIVPVATSPVLSTPTTRFQVVEDEWIRSSPIAASLVDRDASEILVLHVTVPEQFAKDVKQIEWTPQGFTSAFPTLRVMNSSDGGMITVIVTDVKALELVGTINIKPRVGFSGAVSWQVSAFSLEVAQLSPSIISSLSIGTLKFADVEWLASQGTPIDFTAIVTPIAHVASVVITPTTLVTKPLKMATLTIDALTVDQDGSEVVDVEVHVNTSAVLEVRDSGALLTPTNSSLPLGVQATYRLSTGSYHLVKSLQITPRAEFVGLFTVSVVVTTTELETGEQRISPTVGTTMMVVPLDPEVRAMPLLRTSLNAFVRVPFQRHDSGQELDTRDYLYLVIPNKAHISDVYAGFSRLPQVLTNFGGATGLAVYGIPYAMRHRISVRPTDSLVGFVSLYVVVSTVPFQFASNRSAYLGVGDGITVMDISLIVQGERQAADIAPASLSLLSDRRFLLSRERVSTYIRATPRQTIATATPSTTGGGVMVQLVMPHSHAASTVGFNTSILSRSIVSNSTGRRYVQYDSLRPFDVLSLAMQRLSRTGYAGPLVVFANVTTSSFTRQRATFMRTTITQQVISQASLAPSYPRAPQMNAAERTFVVGDDQNVTFTLASMGFEAGFVDLTVVRLEIVTAAIDGVVLGQRVLANSSSSIAGNSSSTRVSLVAMNERTPLNQSTVIILPRRFVAQNFTFSLRSIAATGVTDSDVISSSGASMVDLFRVVVRPVANTPELRLNTSQLTTLEDTPTAIEILHASTPDRDGSEQIEIRCVFSPATVIRQVLINGTIAGVTTIQNGTNSSGVVTILSRDARAFLSTNTVVALVPRANYAGRVSVDVIVTTMEMATGETATVRQVVSLLVASVADAPLLALGSAEWFVNQTASTELNLTALGLVDDDGSELLSLIVRDMSSTIALDRVETSDGTALQKLTELPGAFLLIAAPSTSLRLRLIPLATRHGRVSLNVTAISTERDTGEQAATMRTATLTVIPIADAPLVVTEPLTRGRVGDWVRVGITNVSLPDPTKANATVLTVYLVVPDRTASVAARELQVAWRSAEITAQSMPSVSPTAAVYVLPSEAALREIVVRPAGAISLLSLEVVAVSSIEASRTSQRTTRATSLSFVAVTLSSTTFSLREGTSGSFTVSLLSAPISPVTISFASLLATKVVAVPASIVFTTSDWSSTRSVLVQSLNNFLEDSDASVTINTTITTTDTAYATVSPSQIAVQVLNDDTSGITLFQRVQTTAPALVVAEVRVFSDAYSVVLTAEPTADVVVAIMANLTQLVVVPTSLTFTSVNWNTSQSVAVHADDNFIREGDHFGGISHAITSNDRLYGAVRIATLSVKIVETKDTTPPPKLVSAKFVNTAVGLTVQFDRSVNRQNALLVDNTFSCSVLFELPAATSTTNFFGASPSCSWQSNDQAIRFVFGRGVTAVPGSSLILKGGILKSTAEAELATATTTITISLPDVVPQPVALVSGASSLGLCDDLFLDGSSSSGSGGRTMVYTWILNETTVETTASIATILAQTAASNNASLQIPAASLEADATYSIILRVVNFFGASANSSTIVVKKAGLPLPIVSIQGGAMQEAFRARELSITATADAPSCNSDGAASSSTSIDMTFAWVQVEGDLTTTQFKSTSPNPRMLRLPARTLTVGVKYVFRMVVAMTKTPTITNSATVEVSVLPSALTASIASGDRSFGVEQELALDASRSLDPDDPLNTVPMAYSWTCLMRATTSGAFTNPCTTATDEALIMNTTDKPVVGANTLNPNIFYQFTVRVTKDTRSATSSVVIFFTPGSPPSVTIETLGASKVNGNDRVVLKGAVTSKLPIKRTEWSLLSGGGSASATAAVAAKIFAVPTSGRRTMVLRENSLTPGVTYVFQFLAEDSGGSSSTATISVTANAPPTSGSLTVTPTKGYALDDTFSLQCTDWVDEDLPLRYTYRYIKGAAFSGGPEVTLGSASLDPLFRSIFPIGGGDNTTITLVAYIQDALGAVTRAYKEITVEQFIVPAADQAAYLANKTDAVLASALSGDPSKVLNSISALGDLINGVDESTQVAPTPAPTTARPGTTPSPTAVAKLKSCPTSNFIPCASNGECVRESAGCLETNLACATYCKCAEGFYGDNCAMSQAQYDAKRTVLGSLISAMVTSGKSVDVTDANAVEQQASSIATLTKSASILDAKAQNQALAFVDNLMSAPVLSGTAKTAVGSTVSNLLEIGPTPSKKTPTAAGSTKSRRLDETVDTAASDRTERNSGSGSGGFWSWVGSLSGSGSSTTETGATKEPNGTSSSTNTTDPHAEDKARLAQLQGTIAKLETALLGSAIEGEPPTTLVTKNLKIVAARDSASRFEGTELSLPLSDAERAANFTPPSTTIPKGFGAFVKAAATAARRRRRLAAGDDEQTDEDPTVDIQSSLFTKNPYSFNAETINSPVLSVKVHQSIDGKSEEVIVSNLETPFRIMMRNIEAVPPMVNATPAVNATPQVFFFHCANDTKSTQFFNCSDVSEVVTIECDGLDEYEGNVTCPTKQTTPACRYWDTANSSWSSDGCEAVGTTDDGLYTICECTHLTDFSTQVEAALSQVTTHFKKVISHKVTVEDLKKNVVLLVVMGGFFLLYVIAFFYVSRWDHRDRLLNMRQKRLSLHETKHVKLASSPIFQEPDYVSAVGWKAKTRVVGRKFWEGIKTRHKLLSIVFKFDEHFTRTQRLTVVFTVIMSQMFTNALLYRLRQGEKTTGSAFVAGILSFLCMLPVAVAFMLMFKKAGRKQTYLVRYRVEDIDGNVAEVETDAYGRPKQYSPFEMLSMDLAAIANCVEARSLQAVAQSIKARGIESRAAQVCRGVFLAIYNRDFDEDPPEDGDVGDTSDPLKGVLVKIKAQLQEQALHGDAAGDVQPRSSIIAGLTRKRDSNVAAGGSFLEPTSHGAGRVSVSGIALTPIAEKTEGERCSLALNRLLLMLGQGGGDTMLSNMLRFDPLMVSTATADKLRAVCSTIMEEEEADDGDEVDAPDDAVATTLVTLQDWLAKCSECYAAQENNAQTIAAKAKAELERTEMQLKKLQVAIGSQFEKRLSEIVAFAETVGETATSQNARMVKRTTESAQAARRATRLRARSSVTGAPDAPRNMDRRVTVAIKQQKNAILQANKDQLRERRKTVKETQKILQQERKKLQRDAQKEMAKLVAGLRGVAKMKRKLQLYLEAREKRRVDAMPLHERQLYMVEQQRLKGIKRMSLLLYRTFLRRQPAKLSKPLFPEWVVYVSYVICCAWCVWCAFFVTMFAFEIGQVESQLWIGSLATGIAMTYLISDPLKIFFRMGIMPLIATSVLADSGIFGAIDSSTLAIGAIAVGTAGVAQLVAKRKEANAEKRRLKQGKSTRLVPVTDEDSELRAQAMAIAGRGRDGKDGSDDDKGKSDEPNGNEGDEPAAPSASQAKRGSFTNLWTVGDPTPRTAEQYARQRATIEKELEDEHAEAEQAQQAIPTLSDQRVAGPERAMLVAPTGPPAQLAEDGSSPSKPLTLAQQSTSVLKVKPPSSVFGPSLSARKPPPVVVAPPPRGPLATSLVSPTAAPHVTQRATATSPKPALNREIDEAPGTETESCVCGERVRRGSDMTRHQNELCSHRLVECRAGCGLFIQARSRNGHELSQCRLVMCACGKMVLTASLELHQQRECRNKLVTCRLACGQTMVSHVRDRHERNECPRRIATCRHCGAVKHAADMASHEAVECEVHHANVAVHAAMQAAYAAPVSPKRLNQVVVRRGPPRPPTVPSAVPGAVVREHEGDADSTSAQKLDQLRDRVRARRPPALDLETESDAGGSKPTASDDVEAKPMVVTLSPKSPMRGPPLAAVSPLATKPRPAIKPPAFPPSREDVAAAGATRPHQALKPPAFPLPPAASAVAGLPTVDVSDMSPTRRKMVLGPQATAAIAAAEAANVPSPRADEVAAAAAASAVAGPSFGAARVVAFAGPPRPPAVSSLESESDVQDISSLVFDSSGSESEAKTSPSRSPPRRRPAAEATVARKKSPQKKYEV